MTVTYSKPARQGRSFRRRPSNLALLYPAISALTPSSTQAAVGEEITFDLTATGSPTAWLHRFSDGATSTSEDPVKSFDLDGFYTDTPSVTNAYGTTTGTPVQVHVSGVLFPDPKFTVSAQAVAAGGTVTITCTSPVDGTTTNVLHLNDGVTSDQASFTNGDTYVWTVPEGTWTPTLVSTSPAGSRTFTLAAPVVASVSAAATLIAHTVAQGTSGGTTTGSLNTTGATLLVVGVPAYGGAAPVVTDSKGNTWSSTTNHNDTNFGTQWFYCQGGTVGTGHTFTVAYANSYAPIAVLAFSGVPASPYDSESNNLSSATPGSITPANTNNLAITMISEKANSSIGGVVSGFTVPDASLVGAGGSSLGIGIAYKVQAAATAVNPTWTTTPDQPFSAMIVFKSNAGSGSGASDAPTASFTSNRTSQVADRPVIFTNTSSPSGTSRVWEASSNAGATYASIGTSVNLTYTFSTAGSYKVRLKETNSFGTGTSSVLDLTITAGDGFVVSHFDRVPDFGYTPDKTSAGSGNWATGATWSGGTVPTTGQKVNVLNGHTVTYNQNSSTKYGTVSVRSGGLLTVDTSMDTKLCCNELQVMPGGEYRCGTSGSPLAASHTHTLQFNDYSLDTGGIDPEQFGCGLLAHGILTLYGASKTHAVRLASQAAAGATTITLQSAPTNWKAGDKVYLTGTRHYRYAGDTDVQSEVATIASDVSSTTVSLTAPLSYTHRLAKNNDGSDFTAGAPYCWNRTRNIKITSENLSGTRYHWQCFDRATIDVNYVEAYDGGRTINHSELGDITAAGPSLNDTTFDADGNVTHIGTNQRARYGPGPHLHHLFGEETSTLTGGYQWRVVGCSFYNTTTTDTKWGICTLHDTHFGLLQNNLGANTAGAGIMTEGINEWHNVIDGNHVDNVRGNRTRGDIVFFLSDPRGDGGREGSALWVMCANYVTNNVLSNSDHWCASLYGIPTFHRPTVAGDDVFTDYTVEPNMHVVQFDGNEMHSACAGTGGVVTWGVGPISANDSAGPDYAATTINDTTIWFCPRGWWNYPVQEMTLDGLVIRGDHSRLVDQQAGGGLFLSDYCHFGYFTITNADLQGLNSGFQTPSKMGDTRDPTFGSATGIFTVSNSYIGCAYGFVIEPPNAVTGGGINMVGRSLVCTNCTYDCPTEWTTAWGASVANFLHFIWEENFERPGLNWIVEDSYFFDDITGGPAVGSGGAQWRAWWTQQAGSYVTPQTVGTGFIGASRAGHTNTDNLAFEGVCVGNEIYPSGTSTDTQVYGGVVKAQSW